MRHYPPRKERNAQGWPNRDRAVQARFRRQVLSLSDGQCAYVDRLGGRCPVTGDENLIAHHCDPGNNDPAMGVAVCQHHHRRIDAHAR